MFEYIVQRSSSDWWRANSRFGFLLRRKKEPVKTKPSSKDYLSFFMEIEYEN